MSYEWNHLDIQLFVSSFSKLFIAYLWKALSFPLCWFPEGNNVEAEHEGGKPHPKLNLASFGFRDLFSEPRTDQDLLFVHYPHFIWQLIPYIPSDQPWAVIIRQFPEFFLLRRQWLLQDTDVSRFSKSDKRISIQSHRKQHWEEIYQHRCIPNFDHNMERA